MGQYRLDKDTAVGNPCATGDIGRLKSKNSSSKQPILSSDNSSGSAHGRSRTIQKKIKPNTP